MNNFFVKHKSGLSTLIFLVLLEVFLHTLKCKPVCSRNHFPKIKVIADAGQQPVDKMMVTVTKIEKKCNQENSKPKTVRSTTSRGVAKFRLCGLEC
jgi:hypothetical protein